ncbi:MAG TPA: hypothetical protein DEE98_00015 [Elusimicrobia bacterium]|nr:MAG: hypothetical protein A2204_07315 [Elusimicrobia bacterium RIFOXYA1_FULL_47_7]OGS10398.1 MAG: hypothetical protein A2386_07075 [Elusimicrobia bacterium RIFOXYB1_FULL_48_9]OGS16702.1 MAG: hypothetical protein A2251_00780 [Elusimicrobia bacterium RIFOXYA2_FULL_47_53]OGS26755.1 MAG: hypothetical protein A2339_04035 [Elusimicrobia bacterium RIFOXYB12_FULL_50_12]OGS31661.1 MAG: hypothetical protein A2323_05610 [Elusimicrobia bacterium RIFOXYB2_FULL_46_23]HBU68749.1 hypothetical protein [Elus
MKKYFYFCVTALVSALIFAGCQNNNSTLEDTVTFKGSVSLGQVIVDANGNQTITVTGAAPNAAVVCENTGDSVKSASDGSYTLKAKAVRQFTALNAETYTLSAFDQNGGDEKITVSGKPGETVNVRGFILYKHTEDK